MTEDDPDAREWPFWWFRPPTTSMLDVRVFNMEYGDMTYIENALVEVIQNSIVVQSGYTDVNGKYVTVLGAGTYTIRISKDGYRTITKTETLSQPTELMVNLPMETAPTGKSGLILPFIVGEVLNPQITLLNVVEVSSNRATAQTSLIKVAAVSGNTGTAAITTLHTEVIS